MKKIEEGKRCTQTRQLFLIRQVKSLSHAPKIDKNPLNLEPIELPTPSTTESSVVSFSSTIKIKNFSAAAKWYHDTDEAVSSIKVKGDQSVLFLDSVALNSKSTMLPRKFLAIFPDLKTGTHWHWKSLASKLPKLAVLLIL